MSCVYFYLSASPSQDARRTNLKFDISVGIHKKKFIDTTNYNMHVQSNNTGEIARM
jgi:hypothetical protein